jgi:hypothetical protein
MKPVCDQAIVLTNCRTRYESLADALAALRIKALPFAQPPPATLATGAIVLYDGWPQVERGRAALQGIKPGRELLLLDWPRPSDAIRVAEAGLAGVLPLPFLLSDLATSLSPP